MLDVRRFDWSRTLGARIALVIAGSLLMALGARVAVPLPFDPVPITLQPLALVLVAALLGPRLGVFALLTYLAEGASGLPVFAGGLAGPQFLVGNDAGYLWSYPVAVYAIGRLYELGLRRNVVTRFVANVAGLAIVYAVGATVLSFFVGPRAAIAFGVAPFVALDLAKMALAAFLPVQGRRSA